MGNASDEQQRRTVAILSEVASRTVLANYTGTHPVDIAYAMISAIEGAAETLVVLKERGVEW